MWTVERLENSPAYQQLLRCLTQEGRDMIQGLAARMVARIEAGGDKVGSICSGQYFAAESTLSGHLEALERGDHRPLIQGRLNIHTHWPNEALIWESLCHLLPVRGSECPEWNESDHEVADAIRCRFVRRHYVPLYGENSVYVCDTDTYEVQQLTADVRQFRHAQSRGDLDIDAKLAEGMGWADDYRAWQERIRKK